jgi:hypothetical protein
MKKLSCFNTVFVLTVVLALAMFTGVASAHDESWSFGVMPDTQWTVPDDGRNPNSVPVDIINQVNQEFISKDVKFVVQVGDLTDDGTNLALDTRATYTQALYNAGIGFFPLRGNHESSQTAAVEFKRIFPQTQAGQNNNTPVDAFVTTADDANTHPIAKVGAIFTIGSDFSSPSANLSGLSYSFDYSNARFVLLDQFTRADGTGSTNSNIIDQQSWISSTLAAKPANGHAFVFSHKNLIGENHTDVLFGSDPSQNASAQNTFISSLASNGVRYYISGHDHVHQRSIITSPDGSAKIQEIISGSDSSKFYIPAIPSNDSKYDNPTRETSIAQERNTIGYYIYTVDDQCVTVDYYSARAYPTLTLGEYLIFTTPTLNFIKQETFGYCLNGKEFLVAQGQSYTNIQDSFSDTTARILSGINGSTATDGSGRPMTNAVDTGWSLKTHDTASDVLTLWGMANSVGREQTDVYTLSMNYDPKRVNYEQLKKGPFGLATRDDNGKWVNAVDMNFSGTKSFVSGAWNPSYKLGTYGVDPSTHTAWAVINYNGDFAVAGFENHWDQDHRGHE